VDCIEHIYELKEDTAKKMAEQGIFYTPTAVVGDVQEYLGRPDGDGFLSKKMIDHLTTIHPWHMKSLSTAIRAGVPICTGTDSLPSDIISGSWSTCREMELLVEAGMTPLQAIKAATANGAKLCGLEKITGSLKTGLAADLIAVKGQPDKLIKETNNIELSVKGGRVAFSRIPSFIREREYWPFPPGAPLYGRKHSWE
jgi:imidazolonepropionase-like amidohydrolase